MTTFPVNPPLSDEIRAKMKLLPVKPDPVTLEGRFVILKPMDLARDLEPLYAVSNGQPAQLGERKIDAYDAEMLIWRYLFGGPFDNIDAFSAYLQAQINAANGLPMTVFEVATGTQIGVINYLSNFPEHLKVELGSIWYSPLAQRTKANTEATYLMLKHAFELGYRRLEWKCDSLNERSRRAALRMGFTFEGIQEYHFIIKGRNRDTAWFRILDKEWPDVKSRLEGLLYG
ncbi:MAG: GNAT family N-acetyltransferase [Anaerolineae bacterium]|nr:GNAT family N-acetyltransferase [Anaerolineae bacterium]